jgi:FlaA1/EpsC-like NDP-sugar epimerase
MFNNKLIFVIGSRGYYVHNIALMTLAKYNLRRLVIYSRNQIKLLEMAKLHVNDSFVRFFISNVRDKDCLDHNLNKIGNI